MEVLGFVRALRARLRRVLVLEGLARTVVIALGLCALAVLIDWLQDMPAWWRLIALGGLATCVAMTVHRRLHRPLSKRMDDRTVATLVERRIPAFDGRLLSGIEGITLSADDRVQMAGLLTAATARATVPASRLPGHLFAAAGCIATALLLAHFLPDLVGKGLRRLFLPWATTKWSHTALDGRLAREVVPADEPLVIEVKRLYGEPAPVHLSWVDERSGRATESRILDGREGPWEQPLSLPPGSWTIVARLADTDLTLRGRVVARPRLAKVSARLTPPAYIGEKAQVLSTLSCTALPGSTLEFELAFAMEEDRRIADCTLLLAGKPLPVQRSGHALSGTLVVRSGGELAIRLTDQDGIGPKPDPRFSIALAEDRVPVVSLAGPRNLEAVTPNAELPLKVEAHDDYGLARLELLYQVAPVPKPGEENVEPKLTPPQVLVAFTDVRGFATTRPATLAVGTLAGPGTRLVLVGVGADANDVTGPGIGRSDPLILRVVSEDELRQELDRLLADARERVGQAREELSRGMSKPERLAPASRNALLAARKAGDLLAQAERRWRDNKLPADQLKPLSAAEDLVNQQASPRLGEIPGAGAKAEATARSADQALSEAEKLLGSLIQEGDLSRQLSSLLGRQRALHEESRAFVLQHVTKALDDAAKARQGHLSARQKELADQMKDIERRLLAGTAAPLAEAQDLVRKEQPAERLAQAGEQLGSNDRRGQAPEQQRAAIAAMEKLLDKLRGGDANRGLAEQAGKLADQQERVVKDLEQGMDPKDLTAEQKDLAQRTKELLKQVQEQGKSPDAAKQLQAAGQSQGQAEGAMQKGDSPDSQREGATAAQQLREAQRQLQGDKKDDPAKKKDPDVLALLKELRRLQTRVVSDSTVVHQRVGDQALDFAARREVAVIAENQGDIVLRLNEEGVKELQQSPIALFALKRVGKAMDAAAKHLDTPALGTKGLILEKTALHELTRLIEIAENLPPPEASDKSGAGKPGQEGRQAPFPPAAEIALLAAAEEELAMRTATNHPGDLAAAQKETMGLVQLLKQSTRPGSRPAVLLDRSERAMASAGYLLSVKDRGLATRHEQDAAALSLRRLLAELKGSGGGKGNQQSNQKPQPNPGQPQPGQPQPGSQGGSSAGANADPSNNKPSSGANAQVGTPDHERGALMHLPPERREQLRQAREQNLPPAVLSIFGRYLEVLGEGKP